MASAQADGHGGGAFDGAGTERKTDRLEAFSDAVLAIAITLPVVELHPPDVRAGGDLRRGFADLGPEYAAYAISACVIGLYWTNSHFGGKILRKTDHGFNLLTVLFLTLVSVTPFPARPLVEHLSDPENGHVAALVYVGVVAAPGFAWLLRWCYAVRRGLLDPHLAPDYVQRLTRTYAITAALYVLGVAVTAVERHVGLLVVLLVTLGYVRPPPAPTFKPGERPDHELQEADERDV